MTSGAVRAEKKISRGARAIEIVTAIALSTLAAGCGIAGSAAPSTPPPPPSVIVTVLPASTTLFLGQAQQFSATVTGTTNTAVNWSASGIAGGNSAVGTISSSGVYIAPSVLPSAAAVTITATSQADSSASGSATVNLQSDVVVNVSPNSVSLATGAVQNFTASVNGSGNFNPAVVWSVNGFAGGNAEAGTITSTGPDAAQYTAPTAVPSPPTVKVSATSEADPSRAASASITIGCGSANAVAPATASVALEGTQTFTASLCVPAGTPITWDVDGVTGGNAALGTVTNNGGNTTIFTAPANLPSTNPVTVRATSQSSPTQSATAAVTIVSHVSVTVSPGSADVPVATRATFTAAVAGAPNPAVSWMVNGVANGNSSVGQICLAGTNPCSAPTGFVSGSIEYLAPAAIPSANPVTLEATSQADPSQSGIAQVTITAAVTISVGVSPGFAFVAAAGQAGSTQVFTATVSGTSNAAVTWSLATAVPGQGCSGLGCGTIDSAGLYTAPASAPSPNAIAVVATSQADPSKSGSATVAVTSGPVIESLAPSSVFAGAATSFALIVQGQNFIAGSSSSASAILFGGSARATTCPSPTRCTTALGPADVGAAATLTVQVQNPGAPGALSNPVPFVVVASDATEDVIALFGAQPAATGRDIVVVDPAASTQINVNFIGPLIGGVNCEAQGSPVFLTRPSSGTATMSLCVQGNGLDPSFTYEFSGPSPNDIAVTASSLAGLLPNLVQLNVTISSTTLPGLRTLFITTFDNDKASATGAVEVK